MLIRKLRELHSAWPFQPFSIFLTDGRILAIEHPEFLALTPKRRRLIVATPDDAHEVIELANVIDVKPRLDVGQRNNGMRPNDVKAQLKRQPFVPLLFRLSNGRECVVRHPELVMVGRSSINIGTPAADLPPGVYDTYEIVSLLHLAQIVPMPTAPPTQNGESG